MQSVLPALSKIPGVGAILSKVQSIPGLDKILTTVNKIQDIGNMPGLSKIAGIQQLLPQLA